MNRFSNILFFADDAKGMDKAFARAVELARENRARLTVMDMVVKVSTNDVAVRASVKSLQKVIVDERRQELEKLVDQVAGDLAVEVTIVPGKDAEMIHHIVEAGYDLVVKAPNRGFGRVMFGQTDFRLLRKCPCPVWLVRHTRLKRFRRILAAVDPNPQNEAESELNHRIMTLATSLAETEKAELHVLHAWDMSFDVSIASRARAEDAGLEEPKDLEAHKRKRLKLQLDKLINDFSGADFETHLIKGDPADVISRFVRDQDINLVVMGTVARTGIPGFFIGNTAEEILHAINCSVLAVKPEGFIANLR